ncbi:redoxin domain-containing protein [Chloroflexota bacterium]
MSPKPGLPLEPNKVRCPNPKCGLTKEANKALCPYCLERYCPTCGEPLKPDSRICRGCKWVDPAFKSPTITRRNSSVGSEFSEFPIDRAEYVCPKCNTPVQHKYDSCPNANCGWLGPNVPLQFNRVEERRSFVPRSTERDVSQAHQYTVQSDIQQIYKPESASQLRESASKEWLHSKKLFSGGPAVFKKATGKRKRYWDIQAESGSKVKNFIIAGVVTVLLLITAVFIWVVPGSVHQGVSSSSSEPSSSSLPPVGSVAPPEISNVLISEITESSVIITWVTSKPSTSQVEYGTTLDYNMTSTLNSDLTTSHTVPLSLLSPSTTYHYKVLSKDASGRSAVYPVDDTFTTTALPDTTPPMISGVSIANVSDTTVTIIWETDEKATRQVEYGISIAYGSTTALNENLDTSHSVPINRLEADKTYYFRVKSRDASGNEAVVDLNLLFRTLIPVPTGLEVGKRAPDFTVYDLDGAPVTLSELRGKIVMVNFWAIGCGACMAEMPDIEAVYKSRSELKNFELMAINAGDYLMYIHRTIEEEKWTMPVYVDSDKSAVKAYKIVRIPRTFLIDSSGIIRKIILGRFNNQDQIREALNSLQ